MASRRCPQCKNHSFVKVEFYDVQSVDVPEPVWARIQRAFAHSKRTVSLTTKPQRKKKEEPKVWWYCEKCYYCANLEEYLDKYPSNMARMRALKGTRKCQTNQRDPFTDSGEKK